MFSRRVNAKVSVPISTRYLDWFLRSKSAPDLLEYFRNTKISKEITESAASLFNSAKVLGGLKSFGRDDILCLIPGDGTIPRTGVTTAYHTRWTVVSIDPIAKVFPENVDRLTVVKARAEDWVQNVSDIDWNRFNTIVVLYVHSHAPLNLFLDRIRERVVLGTRVVVVRNECCVHEDITWPENIYRTEDIGIFSVKNYVEVFSGLVTDG